MTFALSESVEKEIREKSQWKEGHGVYCRAPGLAAVASWRQSGWAQQWLDDGWEGMR